jgi:D-xylose transport system substrate-binding protein
VRRIIQGSQAMTVFKDPRQQAAAAFGAAMTLASGGRAPATTTISNGSAEVPSLLLAPLVVDKKNMAKTLLDTGFIKNEELYGPQGGQAR